jgi:hypothetical protein
MVIKHNGEASTDPNHLIHDIYGDFSYAENRVPSHLIGRAILTPKNDAVDDLNSMALESFPGEEHAYVSADKCENAEEAANFPVEFLNTLKTTGYPAHKLLSGEERCTCHAAAQLGPQSGAG